MWQELTLTHKKLTISCYCLLISVLSLLLCLTLESFKDLRLDFWNYDYEDNRGRKDKFLTFNFVLTWKNEKSSGLFPRSTVEYEFHQNPIIGNNKPDKVQSTDYFHFIVSCVFCNKLQIGTIVNQNLQSENHTGLLVNLFQTLPFVLVMCIEDDKRVALFSKH